MFFLQKPSSAEIENFLKRQADATFSYAPIGGTRTALRPSGYVVDHNRIRLGQGEQCWNRAVDGIRNWRMFEMSWLQLCCPEAQICAGTTVAILVCHFGFHSVNPARVVYVLDEASEEIRKFGFAYGTLSEHSESGEERFLVEWNLADNSVSYDLFAFSRPRAWLARAAPALARLLQRRFVRDSQLAMARQVSR